MTKRRPVVEEQPHTLPHNLEAERSVLGAIIAHNTGLELAASFVVAEHFYRGAHKVIWKAILELHKRKVTIDFVTIKEELARVGDLDECGGPAYIATLADGTPRSTNVKNYANIVREKALLRDIIGAANQILTTAYEAEERPDELLKRADITFLALQRTKRASKLAPLSSSVGEIVQRLEWRVEHKGEISGVDTGFASINEETRGWQRKDYVIIGARPSIGKTSFVLNTAIAAARTGKRVALISFEMRREQLEDRILSSLSHIPVTRIQTGFLGAADYAKLGHSLEDFNNLPLHIDDVSGQSVPDIRTSCRRMQNEEGLDLLIIDYAQLIASHLDRRGATRNEELTASSRALKELAGELDIPILLLSQLVRKDSRMPDPRPKLSDLRESGAFEQDADIVAFLHRANHKQGGTTEFILEKQRNGPTGTVNLNFDRDTTTFTDAGKADETVVEEAPKAPRAVPRQRTYASRARAAGSV